VVKSRMEGDDPQGQPGLNFRELDSSASKLDIGLAHGYGTVKATNFINGHSARLHPET
jgi:hypothetical protein